MDSQCLSRQQCEHPLQLSSHGEQPGPLWGLALGPPPQSIPQQPPNEPLVVSQSFHLSLTVILVAEIITLITTLSRCIWAYTLITELLCIIFASLLKTHGNQDYITWGVFLVRAVSCRLVTKWRSSLQNTWVCTPFPQVSQLAFTLVSGRDFESVHTSKSCSWICIPQYFKTWVHSLRMSSSNFRWHLSEDITLQ